MLTQDRLQLSEAELLVVEEGRVGVHVGVDALVDDLALRNHLYK